MTPDHNDTKNIQRSCLFRGNTGMLDRAKDCTSENLLIIRVAIGARAKMRFAVGFCRHHRRKHMAVSRLCIGHPCSTMLHAVMLVKKI